MSIILRFQVPKVGNSKKEKITPKVYSFGCAETELYMSAKYEGS